jgi:hypothetical protein
MPIPTSNSSSQKPDHTQTQVTEPPASGSAAAQPEDRAPVAAASATVGHTPGPWAVEQGGDGPGGYWIEAVNEAKTICGRGAWSNRPAESLANAHLIAAAPELLEALSAVVNRSPGDWKRWHERASAAIAKAEGRQ